LFNSVVKKAFDQWASSYENDVTPKLRARDYGYERLANRITSSIPKVDNIRVLEIGTGPGTLGKLVVAYLAVTVIGVDLSSGMVAMARNSGAYLDVVQCSAESLPFPTNHFDFVYSSFVFHSVLRQGAALAELRRVLKAGAFGILVDLCPNGSVIPFWNIIKGNFHSLRFEHKALSCYRSAREYKKIIQRAGLDLTRVEQLGHKKDYTYYLFEFQKNPLGGKK
jgi:ubiquinone/menaquinone biosynthesis C-methylase UbiE